MPDQCTANKCFGKIIFPIDWQRGVMAVAQLPRPPGALPEWPACGGTLLSILPENLRQNSGTGKRDAFHSPLTLEGPHRK